jgi:hypothetical protein
MMRTLFLQAPSFDGGAGSRYQARREVRSFWYPTWLAQPAALVEGSKLIDAPSHGIKLSDITPLARDYDLLVVHTSTPSFASDVRTIKAMKDANPRLKAGLVGAKVAVDPRGTSRPLRRSTSSRARTRARGFDVLHRLSSPGLPLKSRSSGLRTARPPRLRTWV